MKKLLLTTALLSQVAFALKHPEDSHFYYYDQLSSQDQEEYTKGAANTLGYGFSYQGQLEDNGSPANGTYDFSFGLYDAESAGNQIGGNVIKGSVEVTNGLFSVNNIDFGKASYEQSELWLRITARQTGDPGSEMALSPRQRINVVPYAVQATTLARNGALDGEVLQWSDTKQDWQPAAASSSPWSVSGNDISYSNGSVGIGAPSVGPIFSVKSQNDWTANFDGGARMYVTFREQGQNRGYVGSFNTSSSIPGVNDEDFEVGTTNGSTGNMHIVTGNNQPRITATAEGNVGINTVAPSADLMIDGLPDGDVFRIRINQNTKLYTDANGGTSVGSYGTPPANGLRVRGDVKQTLPDSNGLMKYMVHADCSATPGIIKQYNGMSNSIVTISSGSAGGNCIINFPTSIENRYWQVSAVYASSSSTPGLRNATCRVESGTNDKLRCERFNSNTGSLAAGQIMILVY